MVYLQYGIGKDTEISFRYHSDWGQHSEDSEGV